MKVTENQKFERYQVYKDSGRITGIDDRPLCLLNYKISNT
jgi:hypothetical protein